ncbi:MAG: ADP-ribosylglycohydrolase family protein [Actinomycetaceae bacterium]|nr:ADP-ribosylglycohydrolase family protein [Actinomycetaceae bacterium]
MVRIDSALTDAFLASAFGDAWGYLHEFSTYSQIIARNSAIPKLLKISDDTQMAIATFEATADILTVAESEVTSDVSAGNSKLGASADADGAIRKTYTDHYLEWSQSPLNDRAPGRTVMTALTEVLKGYRPATIPVVNNSLGCGTVMRTPVLAMFTELTDEDVFHLAVVSSTTTHGHKLGHFVGGLAPVFVRRIQTAKLQTGKQAFELATELAQELAQQFSYQTEAAGFIARLSELAQTWEELEITGDICAIGGEGWIADECFITALIGFALALDGGAKSLQERLLPCIQTQGDTDSIACVAGWMIGAHFQLLDSERGFIVQHLEPEYAKWFKNRVISS